MLNPLIPADDKPSVGRRCVVPLEERAQRLPVFTRHAVSRPRVIAKRQLAELVVVSGRQRSKPEPPIGMDPSGKRPELVKGLWIPIRVLRAPIKAGAIEV